MRGLLTEWLTGAGYAVREPGLHAAPAGEGADLVIVDLYMPRQAGGDAVRAVQQAHPGTPVIAMSAQFRPGLDCSAGAAHAWAWASWSASPSLARICWERCAR